MGDIHGRIPGLSPGIFAISSSFSGADCVVDFRYNLDKHGIHCVNDRLDHGFTSMLVF